MYKRISTLLEEHPGVSALAFVVLGEGFFSWVILHELVRRLERMMAVIERALRRLIVHGTTVLLKAIVEERLRLTRKVLSLHLRHQLLQLSRMRVVADRIVHRMWLRLLL